MSALPNGYRDEPPRGFDASEFLDRTARAQQAMQASNLDLLLLTTEADVRYFSGYLTQFWQSPTRPWFLVVPQSGKPVAVIPGIGAACMARTWITDIRTWSSPHPTDDGVSLLCDALQELGGQAPSVGLPMDGGTHVRMPLADLDAVRRRFSEGRFVDCGGLIRSLRNVKSPAEIRKLEHVCQCTSNAFAQVPDWLEAGMAEADAFRRFRIGCLQNGVDDAAYVVGGAGPGGYADVISPPGNRALQTGDVFMLDTGCVWDGYFADFDRNFALGHADPLAATAHHVLWDATEAGLAAAVPGATCSDVFRAMQGLIDAHHPPPENAPAGAVGRLGHGLGTQLTEPPSLTDFDHTEIEVGMVLTLEPGYSYARNKMMVHEENIVIEADGPRLLTQRAPRNLMVIKA